jgi:hypothetical protein
MTKPILFHIGYHKTATSWMQNRLFVSDHGYAPLASHDEIFAHIVNPHGLTFTPDAMQAHIAQATIGVAQNHVPVVSSEIMSGHPFFGGRESDIYAERIKAIAPDARILISIRAQLKILPSVYMQYLLRGGTMPPKQFFRDENDLGYFSFSSVNFEYDRLVRLYQSLFGPKNIYVITQESLRSDMDMAVAKLARFCDNDAFDGLTSAAYAPHPPSYPEYAVPVLRRINHIQTSTLNPCPIISVGQTPRGLYRFAGRLLRRPPLKPLLQHKRPISDHVLARFTGRFTDSNTRLDQLMQGNVDLSGYN